MTISRLGAIVLVFLCVTIAWAILGTSIVARTEFGYDSLGEEVQELWGTPHYQVAPLVFVSADGDKAQQTELLSSDIEVDLRLEHRRKGLLWYATYDVEFEAYYTFRNPLRERATATVTYQFPSSTVIYDDFEFRVGEVSASPAGGTGRQLAAEVSVARSEEVEIRVAYKSRGLDTWRYSFGDEIATVRDFDLVVNTDFDEYDFPDSTISASTKTPAEEGWRLEWHFNNMVSDADVGVRMPRRLNPGPVASRMSYFAPVSLLFFFTVLVVFGVVKDNSLHPMHYFFLGAAFFAFHLLFAYLVDHVALQLAFALAAVVSMGLVVSYLWRVAGRRFALREAAISQFLFLILFSYAFFFEGYTGLVVTVGAIITLAVLMHVTAGVEWGQVFGRGKAPRPD
jgi:hypothetical protein